MFQRRAASACILILLACALGWPNSTAATGVPISGFFPLTGISLTDKFKTDSDDTFFEADYEPSLAGNQLGTAGTPHYDLALLDTGAAISLLTSSSDAAFNVAGAGFRGTGTVSVSGATGGLLATVNNPLSIFASGLANRTGTAPLTLNTATLQGQSSVSLATLPSQSDLPNVLGIPFSSQYATYIRNDQPQIFQMGGRTVRSPQIQFLALGSGGQGITRRVPITLDDPNAFSSPPVYIPDYLDNLLNGDPLNKNPSSPTIRASTDLTSANFGAYFLSASATNKGQSLSSNGFFLDTGADVSVVSELNAVKLGFDPVLDKPDFTVAVLGSGGTNAHVPGFYVDQLTVPAVGGSITLSHVPFLVLDVPNPAHPGNVVDGILGMNVLAGRNVVIDPAPAVGGGAVPNLFVSDPVTSQVNWSSSAATSAWSTGGNWSGSAAPTILGIANVRHVSGGNQTAIVSASSSAWELNVSGTSGLKMSVEISSGVALTTYSGTNIEGDGIVQLDSATLDTQYVEMTAGGILRGTGTVVTGSGPISGQIENRSGTVSPGNAIGTLSVIGNYAQASDGAFAVDVGGTTASTQYDQLSVTGNAALAGALQVSLIGFTPSIGNAFTILTATAGVSGQFESLHAPLGYNWYLNYGVNSVQLVVGIPGDYNHNGIVDAADYAVWRSSQGSTTNLAADGNGNGVIDQGDYTFWKSHFGATMGSGSTSNGAVPEPATLWLLLPALAILCGWRSRRSSASV